MPGDDDRLAARHAQERILRLPAKGSDTDDVLMAACCAAYAR